MSFLLAGYFLGDFLENHLKEYSKYIIFIIFSSMSLKLIIDTLINKGKEKTCYFALKDITLQAIMTSLDSLFLGIPLSFNSNTYLNLIVITGISTFIVCLFGLLIAKKITSISEDKINLLGAIILFIFAFKSLI